MELIRKFVLSRWWHYCKSQIMDFKWLIITSVIFMFIYGYLAASQQNENSYFMFQSRMDFQESSYYYLKESHLFGVIFSCLMYVILTYRRVNKDEYKRYNYVLPISNTERLITDITIVCIIIPLAHLSVHTIISIGLNTFYFSKIMIIENEYLPILTILKTYILGVIFILPALVLKYTSTKIITLFFWCFYFYFFGFKIFIKSKGETFSGALDRIALFANDSNILIILTFLVFGTYQLYIVIKEKQVK